MTEEVAYEIAPITVLMDPGTERISEVNTAAYALWLQEEEVRFGGGMLYFAIRNRVRAVEILGFWVNLLILALRR